MEREKAEAERAAKMQDFAREALGLNPGTPQEMKAASPNTLLQLIKNGEE